MIFFGLLAIYDISNIIHGYNQILRDKCAINNLLVIIQINLKHFSDIL